MAMQPQSISIPLKSSTKICMKHGAKQLNTVIVFDFDDTLFPTTTLNEILARHAKKQLWSKLQKKQTKSEQLVSKMSMLETKELIKLSEITYNLLALYCLRYTKRNVCIISESKPGWVKDALSMVYDIGSYSKIYHLLFDKNKKGDNITIYHPSNNEIKLMHDDFSRNPDFVWKFKTLKQIFNKNAKITDDLIVNTFVIIGDSLSEYDAAINLAERTEEAYGNDNKYVFIDRIKLKRAPTFDELIEEHKSLHELCENEFYQNYALVIQRGFDLDYSEECATPKISTATTW